LDLRPKRVVKDPETRKAEIVEVACDLFRLKGFAATSVQEIVKAAGLSHGAFFYYFPTKQDVLVALGRSRLQAFRTRLVAWIADQSLTPREKLNRALDQVSTLRDLRVAVDFLGFGFIRQDPEVHNAIVNIAVPLLIDDIEALIRQGIDQGEFNTADPRGTAALIILLAADLIHRADVTEKLVPWSELGAAFRAAVSGMVGAGPR
jgi:AcrR family transcriptional regulator